MDPALIMTEADWKDAENDIHEATTEELVQAELILARMTALVNAELQRRADDEQRKI